MSRERKPNPNLDDGPSFDADSIQIPEEIRDTSNFGQSRPQTLSKNKKSPIGTLVVVGALALLSGIGYALMSAPKKQVSPRQVVGQKEDVESPDLAPKKVPQVNPTTPPTESVGQVERKKSEEKKARLVKPVEPAKKPTTEVSDDRPKEKPVTKRRKKTKRKRTQRSLDDALAKLDGLEEESDQNPEKDSNTEDKPASVESAAPESPAVACANGDVDACVKAAKLAQKAGSGEKARSYYGTACAKKLALGCSGLAQLLEAGIGGPPNKKIAASLRAKACQLGDSSSCASVKTRTSTQY